MAPKQTPEVLFCAPCAGPFEGTSITVRNAAATAISSAVRGFDDIEAMLQDTQFTNEQAEQILICVIRHRLRACTNMLPSANMRLIGNHPDDDMIK